MLETLPELKLWPKIPRWSKEVIITEKIDGTNASILVTPSEQSITNAEGAGAAKSDQG